MANTVTITWFESDKSIIQAFNSRNSAASGPDPTGNNKFRMSQTNSNPTNPSSNQSLGGSQFTITCELLEDIDFDVSSDFDNAESDIPFAGLLNTIGRYTSLLGGTSPEILNIFKVATWKSTNPLNISIQPILYARTDGILDVLLPSLSLASLTALKADDKGNFKTPGVFMGNLGTALTRRNGTTSTNNNNNNAAGQENSTAEKPTLKLNPDDFKEAFPGFISVQIPGILSLPTMLLAQCKPKYSKQRTESGAPLWCVLDMKMQSTLPASSIELFGGLKALAIGPKLDSSGKAISGTTTTAASTSPFSF